MKCEYLLPTRAEEIGNRVFDYFAMPAQSFYTRLMKNKAAILVGGRGTGKTMVLKSMAFEYKMNSTSSKEYWINDSYIGCYIRIDTNIVSNFRGRGLNADVWGLLFAHYFNLRVVQQIVKTFKVIIQGNFVSEDSLRDLITRYSEITVEETTDYTINWIESRIRRQLDELVRYINNSKKFECPTLINNGILIFELCEIMRGISEFKNKTWFILLDEFENLDENQQRIINTLIKANQPPVIFKIALRPGGWWTQQTLSQTESLEEIADYDLIDYQNDFSDEDYKKLVIEAFNKSLALNGIVNEVFLDVRNLLPEISPEDEARRIEAKSKRPAVYRDRINEFIDGFTQDFEERELLKSILIIKEDPLRTRFNLVLLDRGADPQLIANERIANSSTYQEWYRHNKVGTLFLFCSEFRTKKTYCGFETFVLLSSKIMRNFVSLFSRTWELSLDEEFSPEELMPFEYDAQSKAAYDVSRSKVFEINSYASIGPVLWSFANYLGRIFERLNKDERQSQPERNHFGIKGQPSEKAESILRGALLNSVLQEAPANKMRSDAVRGKDYLLNRIYCPYYNMSYRKMHKLEFDLEQFELLLMGNEDEKRQTFSAIIRNNIKAQKTDIETKQLSLFDSLL